MNAIRPIETRYKGYRFRSRLEARWAVFFDDLCIEWVYEEQSFEDKQNRYLPDFYLPRFECYIEIKPSTVTFKDLVKQHNDNRKNEVDIAKFNPIAQQNRRLYLLIGTPGSSVMYQVKSREVPKEIASIAKHLSGLIDPYHVYQQFFHVPGKLIPNEIYLYEQVLRSIIFETKDLEWHTALKGVGHTRRWRDAWENMVGDVLYHPHGPLMFDLCDLFSQFYPFDDIQEAINSARSARFEFGESGTS